MHGYASLDENEKCLIQQSELADLRLAFLVSEEAAVADDQAVAT
jgi:hypothetical protein